MSKSNLNKKKILQKIKIKQIVQSYNKFDLINNFINAKLKCK